MSLFHTNTLLGASGSGSDPLYVDDVFQTHLYRGSGSARTITNNIDLSGEGGLVWIKERTNANYHVLTDTERGAQKSLYSNENNAEDSATQALTAFTSSGFSVGTGADVNGSNEDFCSWTFRKTPGFFDIVTWTGNGTAGRTVAHNLGSVPGCIMIKCLSHAEAWVVFHRSLGATTALRLNLSQAKQDETFWFNNTAPTSSEFTLGASGAVNDPSRTYVAYLFAHDDQSFGTNSDEAIIKCGSFAGGHSPNNFVNIGFEPQFLITKQYDDTGNWEIADIMRGAGHELGQYKGKRLFANLRDDEDDYNRFSPKPTGFDHHVSGATNDNFIYIAIRRPHKPPEAATDVFKAVTYAGSSSTQTITGAGFAPDWMWSKDYGASNNGWYLDRLRVQYSIDSSGSGGEQDRRSYLETLGQDGIKFVQGGFDLNRNGSNHVAQFMKRAPGFFDIVSYTGNGSSGNVKNHNLGVVPELMIVKKTSESSNAAWQVYHSALGNTKAIRFDGSTDGNAGAVTSSVYWNDTSPTATQFTLGSNSNVNANNETHIAYLFATLDGISKVGSYSGTGNNIDVDCGFSAAARYILIKRGDHTGSWYIWDHARGIVSGNDPYLFANTTAAQTTGNDYVDPLSSGFTVTSSAPDQLNQSGYTYIFFAIA
jgi:hypothetical protein